MNCLRLSVSNAILNTDRLGSLTIMSISDRLVMGIDEASRCKSPLAITHASGTVTRLPLINLS